jgi:hypothetical protein
MSSTPRNGRKKEQQRKHRQNCETSFHKHSQAYLTATAGKSYRPSSRSPAFFIWERTHSSVPRAQSAPSPAGESHLAGTTQGKGKDISSRRGGLTVVRLFQAASDD